MTFPGLQEKFITNIDTILRINKPDKVAVAVSGGADSVALLHLMVLWSEANNLEVTVFSVDHNLRPESKIEVAYVKILADKFGFHFVPLSWNNENKASALQARARKARYDLMQAHCQHLDIHLLLTAHHFDDMFETYLIKKSKKASLLALAPNITYFFKNLRIVRPLFNIRKQELVDYLLKNNIHWFEDASNKSDKYERSRVRKNLETIGTREKEALLSEYNLTMDRAKNLGAALVGSFAEVVSIYNYGFAKIDINKFNILEEELRIHLLNYVLTIISGKTIVPRYRNITKILLSLDENSFKSCTLSHCSLVSKNGNLIVCKEKAFVSKEELGLENQMIWDSRFKVDALNLELSETYTSDNLRVGRKTSGELAERIEIREHKRIPKFDAPNLELSGVYKICNLKMADYINLKKVLNLQKLAELSDNNHKTILFTLPVIKNLEKVIAIPHISYYNGDLNGVKVVFNPNFISRFTHFF